MGYAGLDAGIIKKGYLGSVGILTCSVAFACVFHYCNGTEIDPLALAVHMLYVLTGSTNTALLILAEYRDRRAALDGQEEARPLMA